MTRFAMLLLPTLLAPVTRSRSSAARQPVTGGASRSRRGRRAAGHQASWTRAWSRRPGLGCARHDPCGWPARVGMGDVAKFERYGGAAVEGGRCVRWWVWASGGRRAALRATAFSAAGHAPTASTWIRLRGYRRHHGPARCGGRRGGGPALGAVAAGGFG